MPYKIGYLMQAGAPDIRRIPPSGPAVHVREVFKELQAQGHQMRLVAHLEGQIWKSDDLQYFEPVIVDWMDRGLGRWLEKFVRRIQSELHLPYAALFESLRFTLACRRELAGFDLLYERMGWVGYGGGLASRWLGIPLVLEVNGDHLSEFEMLGIAPQGAQLWLSKSLAQRAVNMANVVVATGEGWRTRFIERWGVEGSKVSVVENGTQMVDLIPSVQIKSFQNSVDPNEPVTLIFVGGFDPWQGLHLLVKAVSKVLSNGVNIRLLLVGSGTEYENITTLVHDLNLDPFITFTGALPANQLAGCLKQADIGVSVYQGREEYSGLKLLDYKAAGLAIIAAGKGSQPSILEHGRTAWIFPPGDVDALATAICELATDPVLRKNLGREARYEAEQKHSWRNTAKQLNMIFDRLAS
jgi:glycosyltransferase involved in cell wall biosynthesis